MIKSDEILSALRELYKREGTQTKLARLGAITQSTISAYLNEKARIENMPVGVFLRLFRNMKIDYFSAEGHEQEDVVKKELLSIYDNLTLAEKTRLLALAAANFGDNLKENTRK